MKGEDDQLVRVSSQYQTQHKTRGEKTRKEYGKRRKREDGKRRRGKPEQDNEVRKVHGQKERIFTDESGPQLRGSGARRLGTLGN